MKPEEYRLLMRNLELHYQDFMRDSQDSQLFGADDRMQVEGDYNKSTQHFNNLLRSMEKGELGSPLSKQRLWIIFKMCREHFDTSLMSITFQAKWLLTSRVSEKGLNRAAVWTCFRP